MPYPAISEPITTCSTSHQVHRVVSTIRSELSPIRFLLPPSLGAFLAINSISGTGVYPDFPMTNTLELQNVREMDHWHNLVSKLDIKVIPSLAASFALSSSLVAPFGFRVQNCHRIRTERESIVILENPV